MPIKPYPNLPFGCAPNQPHVALDVAPSFAKKIYMEAPIMWSSTDPK